MASTRHTRLGHGARRLVELAALGLLGGASMVVLAQSRPAASTPAQGAAVAATARKAHPLDLSLPPLKLVLTPQQYRALTSQPDGDSSMEDVTIRNTPYQSPVPVGQFRALGWAILHPLDAWRIFLPVANP